MYTGVLFLSLDVIKEGDIGFEIVKGFSSPRKFVGGGIGLCAFGVLSNLFAC